MSELRTLPLEVIKEPTTVLRPIDKNTEDYLSLVESVRERGVLQPILVREVGAEFVLVAGFHRLSAAKDAGLTEIDVKVYEEMDDVEAMTAQIIENVHRAETRPIEFANMIQKIMMARPGLTLKDVAKMLGKTSSWVSSILNLVKIDATVAPMVEDGKIALANAFALSRLPATDQVDMVDRARTTPTAEFTGVVNKMIKEARDDRYESRRAPGNVKDYVAVPHLQKLSALKGELEDGKIADILLAKTNITDAREAFKLAIRWALHLDPISVSERQRADAAYRAKIEARREALAAERANRSNRS